VKKYPECPLCRALCRAYARGPMPGGLCPGDARVASLLHDWPVPMPTNWLSWVKEPQTNAELNALRRSVARGTPYGSIPWQKRTAGRLGLEATLRPRGRPKKKPQSDVVPPKGEKPKQ